jgi:hypothetical protein
MYLYKSHFGEYYSYTIELDDDDLYCERCNDTDTFIGTYETEEEKEKLISEHENR